MPVGCVSHLTNVSLQRCPAVCFGVTRPRPMLTLLEASLVLLERLNVHLGRAPEQTATQQLGIAGERAAYFFLRRQGFTVVARRWTHATLRGEVDLIAWEGDTLAFVEVKTRRAGAGIAAEFRIDDAKRAALRRMANAYVRQLPWRGRTPGNVDLRFDAVSVYLGEAGPPDIRLQRGYL